MSPSETKIPIWKFIPIAHSIIYHHQKGTSLGSYLGFSSLGSFVVLDGNRWSVLQYIFKKKLTCFINFNKSVSEKHEETLR